MWVIVGSSPASTSSRFDRKVARNRLRHIQLTVVGNIKKMKLSIEKNKAIQILQDRINELESYNFNAEAWKERTVLDLKEIFPFGSTQYLKIQFLNFDTLVTSEKTKVFQDAKRTAKDVLNSYIDFIEEYSAVAEQRKIIAEKDFEQKYYELLDERNGLVSDWNNLVKKHEEALNEKAEIQGQSEENERQLLLIKEETIQLDNVSFNKLIKAFFNLPVWQIISIFSIVIAIIVGSFSLGKTFQENASNTQIFDLKQENQNLKEQSIKDAQTIENNEKTILDLKETLNSTSQKNE